MASLKKETGARTGWRLRFSQSRQRRSLWIGDVAKRTADGIARHVDELVIAAETGQRPASETVLWAAKVDGRIHATLEKWGLVEERRTYAPKMLECGTFFETHIASRDDWDPKTTNKYRQATTWFHRKIKGSRRLAAITQADFEAWHRWMVHPERLAQSTANKHAKRIRTLFSEAIKAKLIHENPGAKTKIGGEVNKDRDHYVSREDAAKIIDQCNTEWALIFGLCRFAGFRCPTEVLALKWSDVEWSEHRLRNDSVKTGLRFTPIFPELRPLLNAAWEAAPEGAVYVIHRYRGAESNLRTQLGRIVESAGLKLWQKPFMNLRASCRTDLDDHFAGHVIDEWLGHSATIARKHYSRVTDDHWKRAVTESTPPKTAGGHTGGHISADQRASAESET